MTTAATLADGTSSGYGMGLFIFTMYGRLVVGHGGNIDGFSSYSGTLPESQIEITILGNADAVDFRPLAKSIVAIVTAAAPSV